MSKTISGSKKRGRLHKLFFADPKPNGVIEKLADRLIELRLVQEVFLEDHNSGYMAKIRFLEEEEPEKPEVYIARHISKDFGTVVKG
jgi:hypothetical protein